MTDGRRTEAQDIAERALFRLEAEASCRCVALRKLLAGIDRAGAEDLVRLERGITDAIRRAETKWRRPPFF